MKFYRLCLNRRSLLFYIFIIILAGCTPYPRCIESHNCHLLGVNQKILIPLSLPSTSSNNLLSEDIEKAFERAYKENSWLLNNAEITITDNFDSQVKNIEDLLPYLEKPEIPIIFNFSYSDRSQHFYKILENSGKVIITSNFDNRDIKNVLPLIPGNMDLFNQAFATLSNFIYTKDILLFSDYAAFQIDQVNALCKRQNVKCQHIDSYENQRNSTNTNNPSTIILISQKQLILDWLTNNPQNSATPVIVLDTSFSNPSAFTEQNNSLYWIGPDIWFKEEINMSSKFDEPNYSWKYAQSFFTYQIFKDVFHVIESHLSDTKNGFRHLIPDLLISQLTQVIIKPTYEFQIYQLQNRRFIISEPIKLD